ncbi:Antigen -like protein [Trichinella pseudospiralis]|uniref:TEP1-F n=1 Tax=Trichinella pseudospiralis TaxID=6337 RepID=A0A0V1EQ07_TRIPS|nr:Antigen -like protein [Trichinella pseudospiralis]
MNTTSTSACFLKLFQLPLLLLPLLLLLLLCDGAIQQNYTGSYVILAPRLVRPNLPYVISVNILESRQPVVIRARILDSQNQSVAHTWGHDLQSGKLTEVRIEKIPSHLLPETMYTLFVQGETVSGQVLFQKSALLEFVQKSLSIFIQTDKGIYKPGSDVHIRVVVVEPNMKPHKGAANITITDPFGNVIAQHLDVPIVAGICGMNDSLILRLTSAPALGQWQITVDVDGETQFQKFTVEKYVLPKFEVKVTPPSVCTISDDITVFVSAKYTNGRGVEGNVTIKAEYPWPYYGSEELQDVVKKTTLDHVGEAAFKFANEELRQKKLINEYGYNQIKFTAIVTERLTGETRNGSSTVTVHQHPIKVELIRSSDFFKAGINYTFRVAVKTQDDKPFVSDSHSDIFLSVDFVIRQLHHHIDNTTADFANFTIFDPKREKYNQVVKLESDGTQLVTISTPINASSMRIEAHYGGEDSNVYTFDYIDASHSPSNNFLQIISKQDEISDQKFLTFDVMASTLVKEVYAFVIARGTIVWSAQVLFENLKATLQIESTKEMIPKARLLAYAIIPDTKEILVDALDFKFTNGLSDQINLSITPDAVEPNENVTFTISASPSSYVGLLVVDQSVLLMQSPNDITLEAVENEILSYELFSYGYHGLTQVAIDRRKKRKICYRCGVFGAGSKDAYSIFQNSGIIVITDAFLYQQLSSPFLFRVAAPALASLSADVDNDLMVGSGMTKSGSTSLNVRLRSHFPETWIWADLFANEQGMAVYNAVAPDTITSWIASAFSLSEQYGLNALSDAKKVTVFRPFFIRLQLPYSVKRGETIALQVLVFNYLDKDEKVNVILDHHKDSGFEFVVKKSASSMVKKSAEVKPENSRTVAVKHESSSAAYFLIRPTKVGILKLSVKAFAPSAADAIEVPLLVEAEGYPVSYIRSFAIDMKERNTFKQSFQLDHSEDMIDDSMKIEVSVIGDIMAPVIKNLNSLIHMPDGCGEQNMIHFVPNIAVMQYLISTNRLESDLKQTLLRYMEAGYQRELTYRRNDDSYSAFGNSDQQGSTWLTAFVVRSFSEAKSFIFIDEEKLKLSAAFLASQQKENGMFEENGQVLHKGLQGGSGQGGVPLTAYVYIALLKTGTNNLEALNYLEQSLDYISNNTYALSITAYALHLANSSKKDAAFYLLDKLSTSKADQKFWADESSSESNNGKNMSWYEKPRPADVESTAYALLVYILRGEASNAFPIVRWLAMQQGAFGGFSSSQDTVVGLQALAAFAEATYSANVEMDVTVKNGNEEATFSINSKNSLVLQTYEIRNFVERQIDIFATGRGSAFAQIKWRYNVKSLDNNRPFLCETDVSQPAYTTLTVSFCCKYMLEGRSNMAIMELSAPSGFVIDVQQLNGLTDTDQLQMVETKKQDTQANIYFDSIGVSPICFNVSSKLAYQVTDQKPAIVRLYDYYEPQNRIEFEYKVKKEVSIEDACGDSCYAEISSAALTEQPASKGAMPICCSIIQTLPAFLTKNKSFYILLLRCLVPI